VQIRYVFQVVYKRRRKLAEWLDKGKGPWWLRPLLAKTRRQVRTVAGWPQPRRATPSRRHRFPAWLKQQGAYWFLPPLRRALLKRRWVAVWPPPRRSPTRAHRFPSWLVQQGAYWVSNVKRRRAIKAQRTFLPPPPRRAPTRKHRFPAWLVQQGAYWLRRKPKRATTFQPPAPHRQRRKVAAWLSVAAVVSTFIPRRRKKQPATAWIAPHRAPSRQHRFPAWVFQQGASWLHRRPKRNAAQVQPAARRRRHQVATWLAAPLAAVFIPRHRKRLAGAPIALPLRHKTRPRIAAVLPIPPLSPIFPHPRKRRVMPPMPRGRPRARHIAGVLAVPPPPGTDQGLLLLLLGAR
jgi:hypothetical protein